MDLKEIPPEAITDNTFKLIGKDWMLVTAGTEASFSTITAAWGGLGVLWHEIRKGCQQGCANRFDPCF